MSEARRVNEEEQLLINLGQQVMWFLGPFICVCEIRRDSLALQVNSIPFANLCST